MSMWGAGLRSPVLGLSCQSLRREGLGWRRDVPVLASYLASIRAVLRARTLVLLPVVLPGDGGLSLWACGGDPHREAQGEFERSHTTCGNPVRRMG